MSATIRMCLAAAPLLFAARMLAAQSAVSSPSPTLPSDTLQANYAPRSEAAPMPDLAPSLPSDTLEATQPADSFPAAGPGTADSASADAYFPPSATPGDSAALRDLRVWIQRHPGLMPPPPERAVLVRA